MIVMKIIEKKGVYIKTWIQEKIMNFKMNL